ncbi:MAG: hypothetical protein AAF337_12070 [Pseudomonadota bacterium]
MTFEFKMLGAAYKLGAYSFFDLMDEFPAAKRKTADVVSFNHVPSAGSVITANDGGLKTAA